MYGNPGHESLGHGSSWSIAAMLSLLCRLQILVGWELEHYILTVVYTARTITKTKLSDKIRSEVLLQKSGLKCLNEAVASITGVTVWKAKKAMDPLGQRIFREKSILQCTRSTASKDIDPLVQGYPILSTNIMARIWNVVPGLQHATT
jgi:hypothetical protein